MVSGDIINPYQSSTDAGEVLTQLSHAAGTLLRNMSAVEDTITHSLGHMLETLGGIDSDKARELEASLLTACSGLAQALEQNGIVHQPEIE